MSNVVSVAAFRAWRMHQEKIRLEDIGSDDVENDEPELETIAFCGEPDSVVDAALDGCANINVDSDKKGGCVMVIDKGELSLFDVHVDEEDWREVSHRKWCAKPETEGIFCGEELADIISKYRIWFIKLLREGMPRGAYKENPFLAAFYCDKSCLCS